MSSIHRTVMSNVDHVRIKIKYELPIYSMLTHIFFLKYTNSHSDSHNNALA